MLSLLTPLVVALEEAAGGHSGPPAWVYGLFALVVLGGLLLVTVIFGKGRPHS